MITVYRLIKFEVDDQETMDDQLDRSLADGIHKFGPDKFNGTLTIVTATTLNGVYALLDTAQPTGVNGCITKRQLREHNEKSNSVRPVR